MCALWQMRTRLETTEDNLKQEQAKLSAAEATVQAQTASLEDMRIQSARWSSLFMANSQVDADVFSKFMSATQGKSSGA